MAHLIKKEDFNIFVEQLTNKYNVVGPVFNKKKKMFLFSYLEKGDGIKGKLAFNLPLYPAKDFFLPIKQKFFEFRDGKIKDIREKSKRKTVFFMNRCDINAVHRNDLIMLDSPLDPYYKEKRENAILVEIPCVKEASCHCTNIGLINCYDLKIIDSNGNYILDTLTKKG
ncbi:MAG: hypothetical protein N3D84_03695, partial [Candidatus Woesearchaeota archaeon]|nr:hypothetical protein [Candidatus Woesearchaeota archaeon]